MSNHETFPELRLETPRLLLRPYRAEDAADVALACRDELTQRWLPLPNPYTDADALAWCTEMAPGFRPSGEGVEAAAIRREDGRLIGSFGLKRTDWRGHSSEIGYWVAPWARGEGVAVEATLAIARWLLVERRFERMVLRAATGNLASQRVAEKAGFAREGIARSAGFTNDGRVDLVVFSLTPADLERQQRAGAGLDESAPDTETIHEWYRSLPAKRTGAAMLLTDVAGRLLLVKPTYKPGWEVPGGMVERNEAPHDAVARELTEELGLVRTPGRLLCIDWIPARHPKTDGLMLIFDGGILDEATLATIRLPADELSEHRLVNPEELDDYLPAHMARRVREAIGARDEGPPLYLVDGRMVNGS